MASDNSTPNPPDSKGAAWQKKGRAMVFPISTTGVNVAPAERAVKAALGGAMVIHALRRPSFKNTLGALLGAMLVGEGVTGHSRLYQWFGINHGDAPPKPDAKSHRTPAGEASSALVDDTTLGARNSSGEVVAFITIGKPPAEVYQAWQRPEMMTQIMNDSLSVERPGDARMRWILRPASGQSTSFESEVTSDQPDRIAWETRPETADSPSATKLPGGLQMQGGEVRFQSAPGNQGTEVSLRLRFSPPASAGAIGAAKFLKTVPNGAANKALRRFKALLESGEIPSLENNVSARGEKDKF
ncbi:MAG TPA: SRPBCC family protein [Abditibacterium sp.]|jgi:uncharacterized membrane protein